MFLDFLLFTLGLVFGSFISALSYRLPKRVSVLTGRSYCDRCKNQIAWFDNIPLLSFLNLGGRCRNCKRKISWRYPFIELVSGIGFVLIGVNIFYLFVFLILEAIFIIDLEHQIIPDELIFLAFTFSIFAFNHSLFDGLLSGFICASFLLMIHLVTYGRGMGLGDVKFAILGGFLVGLKFSFVWLLLAFLTGGLVAFILILVKGAKLKDKIAFGPFLVIAVPMTLLFGERLLVYLGFF